MCSTGIISLSSKIRDQLELSPGPLNDPTAGGRSALPEPTTWRLSTSRRSEPHFLNAILWVAKVDVPLEGSTSTVPLLLRPGQQSATSLEPQPILLPLSKADSTEQSWGKLEWFASRVLGNSTTVTVGRATISPGKANPLHRHPNCDEVMHVDSGHVITRVGDREYEMVAGDTITIPEGVLHNTRNIGPDPAVLSLSYSSADRLTEGE